VQGKEAFTQQNRPVILGAPGLLDDGDAGSLGESANRRWKVHVFVVHHEFEDGSSRAAAETVIGLALRIYVKGWRFLPVERAERAPAGSGAL
jgi:hypothetical protein